MRKFSLSFHVTTSTTTTTKRRKIKTIFHYLLPVSQPFALLASMRSIYFIATLFFCSSSERFLFSAYWVITILRIGNKFNFTRRLFFVSKEMPLASAISRWLQPITRFFCVKPEDPLLAFVVSLNALDGENQWWECWRALKSLEKWIQTTSFSLGEDQKIHSLENFKSDPFGKSNLWAEDAECRIVRRLFPSSDGWCPDNFRHLKFPFLREIID